MWRVAKSLNVLRKQVDTLYPNRSKASDGTIGDAAHRAQGNASDHNPWVINNGTGVVTALDITHDPKNGVDIDKLSDQLMVSRDPRIKYIIANGLILIPFKVSWAFDFGWKWQDYLGEPHRNHLHISVNTNNYDDESPWKIGGAMQAPLVNGKDYNLKAAEDFVDKFYRNNLLRAPENVQATKGRHYGELYEGGVNELSKRLKDALKQLEEAKKANIALDKLNKVREIVNG